MTELQRPIRQARRRVWLNRWLAALGWTLAGAAGLFTLLVLFQRVLAVPSEPAVVFALAAGGLAGAAVLVAVIWTWATRESLNLAAARLDAAAGLKERLSTGLYCAASGRPDDPFVQAVGVDASRSARAGTAGAHLPIRFPGSANYAGVSLVVAMLGLWLFPAIDMAGIGR